VWDGTAVSGSDYSYVSSSIIVATGSTSATITLTTLEDTTYELSETFNIAISSASPDITITDSFGLITITDDDGQP